MCRVSYILNSTASPFTVISVTRLCRHIRIIALKKKKKKFQVAVGFPLMGQLSIHIILSLLDWFHLGFPWFMVPDVWAVVNSSAYYLRSLQQSSASAFPGSSSAAHHEPGRCEMRGCSLVGDLDEGHMLVEEQCCPFSWSPCVPWGGLEHLAYHSSSVKAAPLT